MKFLLRKGPALYYGKQTQTSRVEGLARGEVEGMKFFDKDEVLETNIELAHIMYCTLYDLTRHSPTSPWVLLKQRGGRWREVPRRQTAFLYIDI